MRIHQELWIQALLNEITLEMDDLSSVKEIVVEEVTENMITEGAILDFFDIMSYESVESRKCFTTLEEKQERYQKLQYFKPWLQHLLKQIQIDIAVVKGI